MSIENVQLAHRHVQRGRFILEVAEEVMKDWPVGQRHREAAPAAAAMAAMATAHFTAATALTNLDLAGDPLLSLSEAGHLE